MPMCVIFLKAHRYSSALSMMPKKPKVWCRSYKKKGFLLRSSNANPWL